MQVLPRTARRIAAQIQFPRHGAAERRLFEPGVALRHAAWYLAALREEYHGAIVWAAAAYNGGPRRISEHLTRYAGQPMDVAMEELGAHESRNYARKIIDHLVRYQALRAPLDQRLSLDALLGPAVIKAPALKIRF